MKECKFCKIKKSEEEFSKRNGNTCKVCFFISNKQANPNDFFDLGTTIKILDLLLNKKVKYVNDVSNILNIDFDLLIKFLSKYKINGEGYKIRVLAKCCQCGEYSEKRIYEFTHSKNLFCNDKCMHNWQSIIWKGSGSSRYSSKLIKCDWCENEFTKKESAIKRSKNHFCCKECKDNFHNNVFFKSKEWAETNRNFALQKLSNGTFKTDNSLQQKINNYLDDLKVKYINEKPFDHWSVDNYLLEYNLIIEVNGDYWHCNNIKFKKIKYKLQLDRIQKDCIKNKSIFNNNNIKILYLWEYDINNNFELCKLLINTYINAKGILDNYHSFNYNCKSGGLKLNKKIIIPFMDLTKKDLEKYIDI